MTRWIDVRSDTVTQPTPAMREAMFHAEVGDDVYGDDPTVQELETLAAGILGKEAALFVPTGNFGNQLALMTHCQRGDEVILGDDCHIVWHETGGAAVLAGVQLRTIASDRGVLPPGEIEARIRKGEDIHWPRTGLICLENAHSNGRVIPLDIMADTAAVARPARAWNGRMPAWKARSASSSGCGRPCTSTWPLAWPAPIRAVSSLRRKKPCASSCTAPSRRSATITARARACSRVSPCTISLATMES